VQAIEARGLTRVFGHGRARHVAVDALDLDVPQGAVFGCLGPNGAGKTTTIRMLCGVLKPTSGTATVAGASLHHPDDVKSRIGYATQGASIYGDLTVEENLAFKASLFLPPAQVAPAVQRVLDRLALVAHRRALGGELSGGWRQRLCIGTAIVHGPSVLFLDEPTAGLDPVGRRSLWDAIYDLCGEGTTVFVTTHYMDEAERCHSLAMIAGGKVLAAGTPEKLRASVDGKHYELQPPDLGRALRRAKGMPGVRDAWIAGSSLRVSADDGLPEVALGALGSDARRAEPTLEDVFVSLTNRGEVRA
jgi:ABC-2 type transport system ATP-binding protein